MTKTYRDWSSDQAYLFPPSPHDWLPEGDLVYFITDTVATLDLSSLFAHYERELRGRPPFHPRMMVARHLTPGHRAWRQSPIPPLSRGPQPSRLVAPAALTAPAGPHRLGLRPRRPHPGHRRDPGAAVGLDDRQTLASPRPDRLQPVATGSRQRPEMDRPGRRRRNPLVGSLWALPVLSVLAPSAKVDARDGRRHRTLTRRARPMIALVRRWLPSTPLTLVGETTFGAIDLGSACRRRDARLLAPHCKNAALFGDPPPRTPRTPWTRGRPRKVGTRLPTPAAIRADLATAWQTAELTWYEGSTRRLELATGTAPWYQSGTGPLPIR